jgi:hypothetical protein
MLLQIIKKEIKLFIFAGITILFMLILFVHSGVSDQVKILRTNNSLKEIQECKNKVKIELIRTWGSDEETDEKKLFFEPNDILLDNENYYFILTSNEIRIFNNKLDYLRSIGRSGLGPGDIWNAIQMDFDKDNNLVVSGGEDGGLQYFSTLGKYKGGFKPEEYRVGPLWINSKNEIVMLNRSLTNEKSPLWLIFDMKGNIQRVQGIREANSVNYLTYFKYDIAFYLDNNDALFSAFKYKPVIEKYNNIGELTMEIRYEVPFKVPELTSFKGYGQDLINSEMVCQSIAGDSQGNIFVLALNRERREQEQLIGGKFSATGRSGGSSTSFRYKPKIDKNSSDLYQLLILNPKGQILSAIPLNKYVSKIRIFNNILFLIDTYINMTISEYRIIY